MVRFVSGEGPLAVLDGFTIQNGYGGTGGGIDCSGSSPTLKNCIARNSNAVDGGGINLHNGSALVQNCIVYDNDVDFYGSGIYVAGGSPRILHCTVMRNHSYDYWHLSVGIASASGQVLVANTISRENTSSGGPDPADLYLETPGFVLHSNFGGASSANGNLDLDPQFVSAIDFHLRATSPCRDAGRVNLPNAPATDFEGDPRFVGLAPDIGADEYALHFWHVGTPAPGATIQFRLIGAAPGTVCTGWLSAGLTPWRVILFSGQPVPGGELLEVSYTISSSLPTPITLYTQAIAGPTLTNLEVIRVE